MITDTMLYKKEAGIKITSVKLFKFRSFTLQYRQQNTQRENHQKQLSQHHTFAKVFLLMLIRFNCT
jgi:hypothetical protein